MSNLPSIDMNRFVDLVNKYFNKNDINVIMDIGSMDGGDAVFFKKYFDHALVYSIEGLPENYDKFIKNLDDVIGIKSVMANYDGTCKYHQKNINGIHGIYDRGQSYGNKIIDLECVRLDTLCKIYNIKQPDMIKIDVEGATFDVLEGCGDLINNIKIMHIETETYPFFRNQRLHDEVCEWLSNKNFRCIDVTFAEITPKCFQSDSVWINKKFMKDL